MVAKQGLYANIAAKRARIAAGSGEKMRKVGTKGAPTANAFKQAAKTAKPVNKKDGGNSQKRLPPHA
jgi:signal recognition particle GTPase